MGLSSRPPVSGAAILRFNYNFKFCCYSKLKEDRH